MNKELYWEKSLKKTKITINDSKLYPLETKNITVRLYKGNDFIIRKLDTSKFERKMIYGPKLNPFKPWDEMLEIAKIGKYHQLILNKYPVQLGHILLITNSWKPQNGWLDIHDWNAIHKVDNDTSGLWFFNSSPKAGASQPHRHFQLLRRKNDEIICPREKWFLDFNTFKGKLSTKFKENIVVEKFSFKNDINANYKKYLSILKKLGMGSPTSNYKPAYPYNILICRGWIAIIKRNKDNVKGISINALGFAGYILVTEKSDLGYLKDVGPEKFLENFH